MFEKLMWNEEEDEGEEKESSAIYVELVYLFTKSDMWCDVTMGKEW